MLKSFCPLHNGTLLNLTVYADTRDYYCFVCKTGGDVINFLMKIENKSFKEILSIISV